MGGSTLGDISAFITKGATPTTYGYKWERFGVPFLRSECVSDRGLDMRQSMFISEAANSALRRSRVQDGDILMTITGNVGRVVRLAGVGTANINQHIARVRIKDRRFDPDFVYHFLAQGTMREHYESIVTGQAFPQISLAQVRATKVPEISIVEQRAIRTALDAADDLIGSLERLVAKKRAVKTGMMQELLTGHTRLSGFSSDWQDARLGAIATVTMGQSPVGSSYNFDGHGLPLIQGNADIRKRVSFDRMWTSAPTKTCEEGDILLTVRAPVGYTAVASQRSCLGRGVCAISAGTDNRFLFHALVHAEPKWSLYEQGSTFTAVNSNEVRSFVVRWPAAAAERAAIGETLDDVDRALNAMESRLTKARAIKQGMTQELLTNRTRPPVLDEVVA